MLSDGHFGADRGRGAFGIRQLLAGADGAERNVMRDDQADGRFDLLDRGPQHRAVDGGRGDRAVHDVVDLVVLQREHFGQPAADLVEADHGPQRLPAVEPAQLRGGHGDGIEIVVAELAARVAGARVVAEVRAVGIQFAGPPGNWPAPPFPAPRMPRNQIMSRRHSRDSTGPLRRTRGIAPLASAATPQAIESR